MIFGFPQQIASLREPLFDFLREIFQPTRFEARPLLRGFYFASGTQEGNPIDRIMGAMASAFGIGRQAVTGFSGSGRSYFLTRLLRNVVFAEASVVSTNRKEERRRRWRQRFAYGFCAIALLGIGTVWTVSYFRNAGLIDDAERRVALYNAQVEGVELSQVTDPDLTPVLPALATLRDMPGGYTRQDESVPLLSGFGLYQGDKIGAQAIVAYRRALNDLFLPRVLLGLEQVLINNLDDPETLYPALRVYLMLGNQGPMDGEIVRVFLSEIWQRQYPGLGMTETRADLVSHLDAMVDMARLGDVPLNGELIDRARTVLNEVPLAERAYAAIRQAPDARQLTPWRPIDAGGPATNRVFERASGEALSTGIEGLYTHDGFYTYFLPTMIDTANQVAEESWVLGSDARSDLSDQQLALLERDVMQLYLNDYVTVWERMLADLRIIGFTSLNHAVGVLNTMSGPNSPLRNLLVSAAEQTQLSVQPAYLSDPASAAGQVLSGGGASFLGQFAAFEARRRLGYTSQAVIGMAAGSGGLDNIAATATGGEGGSDLPPLGLYVDERFRGLHEFVASGGGGPSPLDDLVSRLADVRTELNSVADAAQYGGGSVGELVTGGGGGALSGLQLDAAQLPSPVGGWVAEVAGNANTALVGGASNRLADAWNADVAELCVRATNNRYPIVRSASSDVTLDDFARLFGPSGRIQTFFDDNLARVVDTSGRTWQWRNVEGVDLGIPSHVLTQFQRANDIQEAFWPDGGGGTPRVSFELTPVSLDRTANQVLLDIDGETITYSHGPPRASRITWPGNAGRARIAFSPQIAGASSLTREGGWAFFRLLDTASISASGASDRFNVSFNVGDRSATFRLQAGSVNNPFNLPALSSFRCPTFQ